MITKHVQDHRDDLKGAAGAPGIAGAAGAVGAAGKAGRPGRGSTSASAEAHALSHNLTKLHELVENHKAALEKIDPWIAEHKRTEAAQRELIAKQTEALRTMQEKIATVHTEAHSETRGGGGGGRAGKRGSAGDWLRAERQKRRDLERGYAGKAGARGRGRGGRGGRGGGGGLDAKQIKDLIDAEVAKHVKSKGDKGDTGERGPPGSGSDGSNSNSSNSNAVGLRGPAGPAGPRGPAGPGEDAGAGDTDKKGHVKKHYTVWAVLRLACYDVEQFDGDEATQEAVRKAIATTAKVEKREVTVAVDQTVVQLWDLSAGARGGVMTPEEALRKSGSVSVLAKSTAVSTAIAAVGLDGINGINGTNGTNGTQRYNGQVLEVVGGNGSGSGSEGGGGGAGGSGDDRAVRPRQQPEQRHHVHEGDVHGGAGASKGAGAGGKGNSSGAAPVKSNSKSSSSGVALMVEVSNQERRQLASARVDPAGKAANVTKAAAAAATDTPDNATKRDGQIDTTTAAATDTPTTTVASIDITVHVHAIGDHGEALVLLKSVFLALKAKKAELDATPAAREEFGSVMKAGGAKRSGGSGCPATIHFVSPLQLPTDHQHAETDWDPRATKTRTRDQHSLDVKEEGEDIPEEK